MSNWTLNSKLEYAPTLANKFKEIKIQHIYWEVNFIADQLANKGEDSENILIYNKSL